MDNNNQLLISTKYLILVFCCFALASCTKECECDPIPETTTETPITPTAVLPLHQSSIVHTDIDFIKTTDPDAFVSLEYIGQDLREMPDKRTEELFDSLAYVFEARFSNDKVVGIWAHSSFGSQEVAEEYAIKLTGRLGKLPTLLRDTLNHVIVHKGDEGAFAEDSGHFFVLYSDNMDTRISNNDLEETVFHETIHASLDLTYLRNTEWLLAQIYDGNFITEYAENNPTKEDLAETAIFVYTMVTNPGRLSSETEEWVKTYLPNRYAFLKTLFE